MEKLEMANRAFARWSQQVCAGSLCSTWTGTCQVFLSVSHCSRLIPNIGLWVCQLFWWNWEQPLVVANASQPLSHYPVFSQCDTSLKQLFLLGKWRKKGNKRDSSTCVVLKHWLGLMGTGSTCKAIKMSLKTSMCKDYLFSLQEELKVMV